MKAKALINIQSRPATVKKGICPGCWEIKEPNQQFFCKSCQYIVRRYKQNQSKKLRYKVRRKEIIQSSLTYYRKNRERILKRMSEQWHEDVQASRLKRNKAHRTVVLKKLGINQFDISL